MKPFSQLTYDNPQRFHSIILKAVVGPDYRFIYTDTGAYG